MSKRAEYLGPRRRKPLVLDAATTIFAEGGFADASMSAIAERAGVSKAVLYDCFPGGKQEIYYALLDRIEHAFMDRMMAVLETTNRLPLDQALREGMSAFVEFAREEPDGFRIVFGDAGTADPEIARRSAGAREAIVGKIGERTAHILEAGGGTVTARTDLFNRSLVAVAKELAVWALEGDETPARQLVDPIVTWLMRGFEHILPGTAWREPVV